MNYKENINLTLKHDLCTGCGVCEGACPSGAISTRIRSGRFVPYVDEGKCKSDKGCKRCKDICPGLGVNLNEIARRCFSDNGIREDRLVGKYYSCYSGYSNNYDIRYHCTSGGMVSQFIIFLLESGYIDGAYVTKFDPENELLAKGYIARTKEEVLQAKGSKYGPVTLNNVVKEIKSAKGSRFVVVGLPCHIQALRKLEEKDKKLRDRILGYFGLYCSSGRTFYLTEKILKDRNIKKEDLTYFAYRDEGCLGSMVAKWRRGSEGNGEEETYMERYQQYYHPLRSFFIPRRCLFCVDHYSELADVSFGDIHIEPYKSDKVGVNSLVVRSKQWDELLIESKEKGYVSLEEISVEVLNSSQKMAYKKKGRNFRFVALNRNMGKLVPKYDDGNAVSVGFHDKLDYAQNRFQQFIGRHKRLWWVINLLKKNTSNLD